MARAAEEPGRCLPLYAVPAEVCALPSIKERWAACQSSYVQCSSVGPFGKDSLVGQAECSLLDQALVAAVFLLCVGGPLLIAVSFLALLLLGSWSQLGLHTLVTMILACHPVPRGKAQNAQHPVCVRLSVAIYRYFSYRFVWTGGDYRKAMDSQAWLGPAPPHGALPLANLLCLMAINQFGRPFIGGAASVVFYTPFLRYWFLLGGCPVSGRDIVANVKRETCVGICPDGIAGIFTAHPREELVALKHRKGLARLMLKTGVAVLPAYSIGNTQAYKVWYDSFGVMEAMSRWLKVSIFIPYGRWGLPIPFRCNLTMLFGESFSVKKLADGVEPSKEQVDQLHERILEHWSELFNKHKASLGWHDRVLKFV